MKKMKRFGQFANKTVFENSISTQLRALKNNNIDIKHQKIIDEFNPNNIYDVYWGKNKESNHFLTSKFCGKFANPIGGVYPSDKDIWLHASGHPGSHVLIKALRDDSIPESIIKKAALIAKNNSKAKNENMAPIVWCYSKNVSIDPNVEILNKIKELENKPELDEHEKKFIESNKPAVGRAFIETVNRNIIYI
ncbi:MAG: DUF814 domain-containing protein [Proteobacteria bacterium]|nr:DUF814 domain-containing protein [Pseudomonadota bacterium]NBP16433.1 DUF814 domain-containing protein [bacterium]